jgi:hypothetical protein
MSTAASAMTRPRITVPPSPSKRPGLNFAPPGEGSKRLNVATGSHPAQIGPARPGPLLSANGPGSEIQTFGAGGQLLRDSCQLVDQRLGVLELGGVEALGETSHRPGRADRASLPLSSSRHRRASRVAARSFERLRLVVAGRVERAADRGRHRLPVLNFSRRGPLGSALPR